MPNLMRIILRLARNPDAGFPDGDPARGYTIVAPLQPDGHLDEVAWREHRDRCTVVRFSPDPDERADGWLKHRGARWSFHYDEDDEGPDEDVHRLGDHKLVLGEYVSIFHGKGEGLTYRVSEVSPA